MDSVSRRVERKGEVRKGHEHVKPLPCHYWTQINVNGIGIIQILGGR